jgi:predicted nuclease of predicted toxin-antitoxin system
MRFLADMGISLTTVTWLRNQNHDARHLMEDGLERLPDYEIVKKAREEQRVILTCDLDFGYLTVLSADALPSVIILRLENEKPSNQIERINNVINEASLSLLNGAIISVEDFDFRVRHLPIKKL